jgi:hypothetical protein
MKKTLIKVIPVIAASLIITGCATILGKSRYPVTLNSTPNVANVLITNKKGDTVFNGKTPAIVNLKAGKAYFKKEDYLITFSADGFKEKKYTIKSTINGFYFGNILIGGAIGMLIIDPLSGKMWSLPASQTNINATLSPSTSLNMPLIKIIDLANVPVSQRENLVLIDNLLKAE